VRSGSALILAAVLVAAGCSSGAGPGPVASRPGSAHSRAVANAEPAPRVGCAAALVIGPLPDWARSGFHPPDQAMPHVMGVRGTIVAILSARRDALHAPSLPDQGNKILWVARQPGAPLTIRAVLDRTGRTATVSLPGGTGPSLVNLPAADCWTLSLTWPGHRDQVQLRYAEG
jgi:hypothetical protein